MFGLLQPNIPDLKVRDAEYYRAAYCGVCRELKKEFGDIARFSLRYEAALLAVIWMSLADERPAVERRICAARPLRPHAVLTDSDALSQAGRICVVLAASKAEDAVRDRENTVLMKAALAGLGPAVRKARSMLKPETLSELISAQNDLVRLEKDKCSAWDETADTSGRMLRAVFSEYDGVPVPQKEPLAWMGYHLGRWLYLTDAFLDADEDAEKGSYNPILLSSLGREEAKKRVKEGADYSAAQALAAYDLMDWHEGGEIPRNLILFGMPAAYKKGKA